jgi:hypothetical protein
MRPRLFALLVCGWMAVLTSTAWADDSVDCGLLEIRASTSDTAKVADQLKVLEKKLKRPPFSSWNTFELLSSNQRTLPLLKAQTLKLTDGQATVLYRENTEGKKKKRLALTVTMDDKEGKRVVDIKVNVDVDDYVVVGRSIDNGKNGHVLALSCH